MGIIQDVLDSLTIINLVELVDFQRALEGDVGLVWSPGRVSKRTADMVRGYQAIRVDGLYHQLVCRVIVVGRNDVTFYNFSSGVSVSWLQHRKGSTEWIANLYTSA
jgi:hypothetical protein